MKESEKNKDFFAAVYEIVRLVPAGRVTTYGAIGRFLGSGRSARMVGWAMNNSFGKAPPVPAHRVVNRKGMLTGKHHFSTSTEMEDLLKREGVQVKDDRVQRFEKLFWDPAMELDW
ncbi:MAG: MGMT family protein [Flavobacteriales bacterium]